MLILSLEVSQVYSPMTYPVVIKLRLLPGSSGTGDIVFYQRSWLRSVRGKVLILITCKQTHPLELIRSQLEQELGADWYNWLLLDRDKRSKGNHSELSSNLLCAEQSSSACPSRHQSLLPPDDGCLHCCCFYRPA